LDFESILSKNIKNIPTTWAELFVKKLNEPQKHYHNMYHFRKLFDELQDYNKYNSELDENSNKIIMGSDTARVILFLSIWFHDIIYDP